MLTTLLPSRMAPISRSRASRSRLTMAARRSPAPSSACMRAREAAVMRRLGRREEGRQRAGR